MNTTVTNRPKELKKRTLDEMIERAERRSGRGSGNQNKPNDDGNYIVRGREQRLSNDEERDADR